MQKSIAKEDEQDVEDTFMQKSVAKEDEQDVTSSSLATFFCIKVSSTSCSSASGGQKTFRNFTASGRRETLLQVVDQNLLETLLQVVGWKLYCKWLTKIFRKLYCKWEAGNFIASCGLETVLQVKCSGSLLNKMLSPASGGGPPHLLCPPVAAVHHQIRQRCRHCHLCPRGLPLGSLRAFRPPGQ